MTKQLSKVSHPKVTAGLVVNRTGRDPTFQKKNKAPFCEPGPWGFSLSYKSNYFAYLTLYKLDGCNSLHPLHIPDTGIVSGCS